MGIYQSPRHPRDRGKPRKYRTDPRCADKRRMVDEAAARAMALVAIEERKGERRTDRLWVYRCNRCDGWHLTSKSKGSRWLVQADPQRNAA